MWFSPSDNVELRDSRRKGLYLNVQEYHIEAQTISAETNKKTDKINIRVTSDIKQAKTIEYIIIKNWVYVKCEQAQYLMQ